MMKSLLFTSILVLVLGMGGIAGATSIYFDLAGAPKSSVSVIDYASRADLTATLASGLDSQIFTLADGATKVVDFFTLTASGFGLGTYDIQATLAFDMPNGIDPVSGSGSGYFLTFFGWVSGGILTWDPSTLPDIFTVAGNTVSVDFEDGLTLGFGKSVMVHAYITNLGGGAAPVPEPSTMLLLGIGLISICIYGHWRMRAGAL